MCDTPHWLRCLHERVIYMVIHVVRLSVCSSTLCSSPCSFPCVSPIPCSSLSTSTWTLTWTSSSMWSSPRQSYPAPPPNWGVCPLGRKHPLTALRWTRILIRVDHRSRTQSHKKTVFGYSATRRTSFRSWFLVYQRVLPEACLLQHPWHLQSKKLIIPRLPQARLPHLPWHLRLCEAKAWLNKNGETRVR